MDYSLNKEDEKNELPEVRKTFFKTHQEKGYPYFTNTRVGSCSYVLVKNGQCLAVPFSIINRRGRTLNHFKTVPEKSPTTKSTYMNDYITFGNIHCGMDKKPLVPYNMDSSRSRLPINGIVSGAAINRSSLELGDYRLINRKQWKSTYKDSYRKPFYLPVSNPGIVSDLAKSTHLRLNAI
jgi:hypothetical protein